MKLTPPKVVTFVIAVILAFLGLLGYTNSLAMVEPYSFWFLFAGFVLLAIACLIKGL
jgi:uncharacterized membrane protein